MKRAYAAAVMVAGGLLAPVAQAQAAPNDAAQNNAQNNQDDSDSVSYEVPPFDPGYWTPDRMRDAQPAPMPVEKADLTRISQQAGPIKISDDEWINEDGDRVSDCCISHTVPPFDPGYWTPERMRNAEPAPMPHFPKGQDPVIILPAPLPEPPRIPEDPPATELMQDAVLPLNAIEPS